MIYGYARISTGKQSIDRQIRNIEREYPTAKIIEEIYTGTSISRPEWDKLVKRLKSGDTVIFDSVSRMSRTAEDGMKEYMELYRTGIELIFLKEPTINTAVYRENSKKVVPTTGDDVDVILEAVNKYIELLAEKQIKIAFDQAEKEVQDLHKRTKEGIETARLNGKQIGLKAGTKLHVKKKEPCKEQILRLSKDFNGENTDSEVMKLTGLARNTYYKYKAELREQISLAE